MYEVTDDMPRHARMTLLEPDEGWTRAFFEREMTQYARDRGAVPRTATLHPQTMATLGFCETWTTAAVVTPRPSPLLVSSADYPRHLITLYE